MTSCNKCTMCTDDIIYAVDPIPESPRPLGRRLYVDSSVTRIQGPVEEHMPATPKSQKIRIPGWRKHCEALDRECDQRFASQDHEQQPSLKIRIPGWRRHCEALDQETAATEQQQPLKLKIPGWGRHIRELRGQDLEDQSRERNERSHELVEEHLRMQISYRGELQRCLDGISVSLAGLRWLDFSELWIEEDNEDVQMG